MAGPRWTKPADKGDDAREKEEEQKFPVEECRDRTARPPNWAHTVESGAGYRGGGKFGGGSFCDGTEPEGCSRTGSSMSDLAPFAGKRSIGVSRQNIAASNRPGLHTRHSIAVRMCLPHPNRKTCKGRFLAYGLIAWMPHG